MIGQKLNLPATKVAAAPAPAAEASAGASNEGKSYRVKAGDNLSKIAKANGVSLQSLREANICGRTRSWWANNSRFCVGRSLPRGDAPRCPAVSESAPAAQATENF